MAEITLDSSTSSAYNFKIKIIYTVSSGAVTVTGIQGYHKKSGWTSEISSTNDSADITVTIGGTSKSWTANTTQTFLYNTYSSNWNSTNLSGWSFPGGGNKSISVSLEKSNNDNINNYGLTYNTSSTINIPAVTYTISYAKGSYSNLTNMPSSSQTKTHGTNINLSSTVPYYTESNINGYVLTWNTNGGTGGAGTTTMKNTTKTTLKQWQSSRNSSLWKPGESYNGDGDVTMTAYSFNDSTVTSYGTLTALPTQPTRTNYTFQSWNTKADGTGYTLGVSSGYTLPYQPNANTIFYAIWKRNQASIKIKTGTSTWSDGLVWVKDSNGTWQRVLKVYVKTDATTWTESNN